MPFTLYSHRRSPVPVVLAGNICLIPKRLMTYLLSVCLLLSLLVLSSVPAFAEWILTSGDDEVGLKVYVDPESIRRKGSLAKM